jgi:transcriptional regulator with XRE-family HTH domain
VFRCFVGYVDQRRLHSRYWKAGEVTRSNMNNIPDTTGEQAGAKLRHLRDDRGWSLAEMARQVPYSKSYLSKLETGTKRITPDIARCIDEALGTDGALAAVLPAPESSMPADDELESTDTEICPYPGLAAFGPDQARWFFGRDQITAHLISQLDDRLVRGGPLAVVAPSGAGKSSLLAAGLIPALARGALPNSQTWPVITTTPGAHPLATLAAGVVERTGADPADAAATAGDPERFAVFLTGTAIAHSGQQKQTSCSARVVLIVDQFEETFTECQQEAERQAFIAALCTAARSAAALVVLGIRADFYGSCLAYPVLLTALQGPVAVGPMTAEQLRAAITRPAAAEGLDLEPGLVELLLRDLGAMEDAGAGAASYDPGALPLLAHALRVTWQQRDGQMLTVAGYRRTGGIRQALATTAERAYTSLGPPEQQIARQVLLRLVNVSDQGGRDTRRRLPRARLVEVLPLPKSAPAIDMVLEAFGRARLLTFDTASVEITHEALLRAWPRLQQWIDTDRAGNLIRQELDQAAAVWDRDHRDTAGLYRGSRLEAARTWAASHAHEDDLSPAAAAFLAASTEQERRASRSRRTVLVVLSTLLTLALIATGLAVWQQQRASAAQRLVIARSMVAQADRIRDRDPRLALQLGVAARQFDASPQTHGSLTQTLTSTSHFRTLRSHTNAVDGVAFAPDGRTLATASADRTVRL